MEADRREQARQEDSRAMLMPIAARMGLRGVPFRALLQSMQRLEIH